LKFKSSVVKRKGAHMKKKQVNFSKIERSSIM